MSLMYDQMKLFFDYVTMSKPRSSRATSNEAFIVCKGFRPVPGYTPLLPNSFGIDSSVHQLASFLKFGDLLKQTE